MKPGLAMKYLRSASHGLSATTPSVGQGIIINSAGMDNDPRMFQVSIPINRLTAATPC